MNSTSQLIPRAESSSFLEISFTHQSRGLTKDLPGRGETPINADSDFLLPPANLPDVLVSYWHLILVWIFKPYKSGPAHYYFAFHFKG